MHTMRGDDSRFTIHQTRRCVACYCCLHLRRHCCLCCFYWCYLLLDFHRRHCYEYLCTNRNCSTPKRMWCKQKSENPFHSKSNKLLGFLCVCACVLYIAMLHDCCSFHGNYLNLFISAFVFISFLSHLFLFVPSPASLSSLYHIAVCCSYYTQLLLFLFLYSTIICRV